MEHSENTHGTEAICFALQHGFELCQENEWGMSWQEPLAVTDEGFWEVELRFAATR